MCAVVGDMCCGRQICSAANKDMYEALAQIRPVSIHGIVGAKNFVPVDANIELSRICGQM